MCHKVADVKGWQCKSKEFTAARDVRGKHLSNSLPLGMLQRDKR